ncbi:hypothetical protein WJX77_003237 [Trebouxia sp. C0004]
MKAHLHKCENVSDKIRALAEDWSKDRTMNIACKPGSPPERLWRMVKKDAPELCQLALRLMRVAVNSAGCERMFSQMGLTHTKVRNRLAHAKVTHIAQLRQELHRSRPTRKKAPVVAGGAASSSQIRHQSGSQLMDLDALTSASEFHVTVNAWTADIDAEERQATTILAYQNTQATTKDTLSNIFAPSLLPLLDDDSITSY